jgi:pimeloyl-ACP methyl ester carboxylesterase
MNRLLSAVTVFVLLSGSFGLFAAAQKECGCGTAPIVVVSGFATVPLVRDVGTDSEEQVWAPSGKIIINGVTGVLYPLLRLLFTGDWTAFFDESDPKILSIFESVRCDDDGEPVYDLSVRKFPLSADNYSDFYNGDTNDEQAFIKTAIGVYGGDHVYFFSYDWRLDPVEHARELRDFIKNVKKETGHRKVTIAGCSMGGNVILSYLRLFGSGDIHNYIMDNAAFQGMSLVGELLKLDFGFDVNSASGYIYQFSKNRLLDGFLRKSGILDFLIPRAEDIIDRTSGQLSKEVLYPVFANIPGIWSLVPHDSYEDAKAAALDSEKNAKLIKKIDFYHYEVQQMAERLMKKAKANGTNIIILSNYNYYGVPITSSRNNNNDILIDTKYSSGGATCAGPGGTLGDGYVQKKMSCGHNHVSPDGVIDASTCMFPEYTWFVKDMKHLDFPYGSQGADFLMWIAGAKEQPTVHKDSRYPQFMKFDYKTGELTPQTVESAPAETVVNPQTGG